MNAFAWKLDQLKAEKTDANNSDCNLDRLFLRKAVHIGANGKAVSTCSSGELAVKLCLRVRIILRRKIVSHSVV